MRARVGLCMVCAFLCVCYSDYRVFIFSFLYIFPCVVDVIGVRGVCKVGRRVQARHVNSF